MHLVGTREIRTQRLTLRKFQYWDYKKVYNNWTSDPEVTRHMRWSRHENPSETARVVWNWCRSYKDPDYFHWGIEITATGELIGSMRLTLDSMSDHRGEVGYSTGRAFWHNGYATEALRAVIDYGFNQVGLNRIEGYCSVQNPASGMVMQRAGMQPEGVHLRYCRLHTGEYVDCRFYAILREEHLRGISLHPPFAEVGEAPPHTADKPQAPEMSPTFKEVLATATGAQPPSGAHDGAGQIQFNPEASSKPSESSSQRADSPKPAPQKEYSPETGPAVSREE